MSTASADHPFVTVVMPVRNEARHIERSLSSVLAQDYPADRMEVLVVDGMSTDGTRQRVKRIAAADERVRLLDNVHQIVPVALNIGVGAAAGDFVFRLDGHSEFSENYVRACVETLQERPEAACVGGPSVAVGHGVCGQAYAAALRSPFGAGGRTFRTLRREAFVDTLAFGGYRRSVFREIGRFDETLARNQDIEFNARLRRAGGKLLLIPEADTQYHAPENLIAIARQNYSNGWWNVVTVRQAPASLSIRHFVPFLSLALGVILLGLSLLFSWARVGLLLLMVAYASLSFGFSLATAVQHGWRFLFLMPLVFATLHVSYALGTCVAVLNEVAHWLRCRLRGSEEVV